MFMYKIISRIKWKGGDPFTVNASSWLLDPPLDKARVGMASVVKKLRELRGQNSELLTVWERLQDVTTARRAMAEMNGLVECRHQAAKNLDAYSVAETQLNDELELRWAHLEKNGNKVLEEYLNASNSVEGTSSPYTSSAVGLQRMPEGDRKLGDRRAFVFFWKRGKIRDGTC